MVLIIQPLGRFGNNVHQLIQAIHIAETFNINVIRFRFGNFKTDEIRIYGIKNRANRNHPFRQTRIVGNFFYDHENYSSFPGLQPLSSHEYRRIALEYLRPIVLSSQNIPFQPNYDNTLFVHIRSGDIFRGSSPHPNYVQPPIDYYRYVFSIEEGKDIVVLYEDDGNPVVNSLRGIYPNIQFYSLPLYETIHIFMCAKYIVSGFGTFIPSITSMNDVYQRLYHPGNLETRVPNSIAIRLPGYIQEWKNTEEQRRFMITYTGATQT